MEQTTSVATSTLPLTSMPSTYGSELPAYHTLLSPQSVMTAQRTFGGEIWQPMHLLHASSEGGAEYPEERRSAFRPILPRPQTILDPPQTTSINSLNSPILSTALTSDKFRFHMPPPLQHQPAPPTMPPPPLVSRPPFQPYSTRVSTPVSSPVSAPAATEPHQTTIHYRMTEQRPQSYQSAATKTTQTDPDIELLERSGQRFLNNFYKTMENNITRNRPISRSNYDERSFLDFLYFISFFSIFNSESCTGQCLSMGDPFTNSPRKTKSRQTARQKTCPTTEAEETTGISTK